MQRALGGVAVDGQFGYQTRELVVTYQKRHNLAATGTVTRAFRANLIPYITNGLAVLVPPVVKPPVPPVPPVVKPPVPPVPPVVTPTLTPVSPVVTAPLVVKPLASPLVAVQHYVTDPALRRLLTAYQSVTLRQGNTGRAVVALQKALRVTSDGDFGPVTRGAVVRFQQSHHLPVTGVVTSRMWLALAA